MPTYNGARFVRRATESVLSNGFTDFEIVIVDDASTEDTVRVVESIRHPALRLVRHSQNLGVSATRYRRHTESHSKQSSERIVTQSGLIRSEVARMIFPEMSAAEHAALVDPLTRLIRGGQRVWMAYTRWCMAGGGVLDRDIMALLAPAG